MTERRVVKVRIQGRVQQVGFRIWVEREALARGLDGWVRNRADGSVEALVGGAPAAVDRVVESLWRGPPHAHVTHVDVGAADEEDGAHGSVGGGFEILPTA